MPASSSGASEPAKRSSNPFDALRPHVVPGEPAPAPAPAPKAITARLTVRRERAGRGGKTVTIAEGPAFAGRPLVELARDAAKALGTGARVEGQTLVVQGDQADRLVDWLGARGYGSVSRGN